MRLKLELQILAALRVEGAERFVHQEDLGAGCERSRNGDALAHAAGDLIGIGVGEIRKTDELKIVCEPCCLRSGVRSRRYFMPKATFSATVSQGNEE